MSKIKLALFIDNFGIGGIQKSIINILKRVDYQKYKIDLYYFTNDTFLIDQVPKQVNIIKLKKPNQYYKFIPFSLAYRLYKSPKIGEPYDIAIDFDSYQFATSYYCITTKANKHIIWIHNDIANECKYNIKYRILHFFMKSKYKYFDTYVGVSEGVIEPFKTKNKIKNNNFNIIPNYIDTDEILEKSKEKVNDIKVDPNKYNLISIGRLCYQKGYDIFINDFKQIIQKRKNVHFYLVGDGEERKKLKKLVIKNKLENYITFTGKKSNPYKYLNLMDGFVLTSRYEGQGMAILEAYFLGLEIFITKNIEKYNGYNIKGRDNIIEDIINAKKHKKTQKDLKKYNDNITKKLEELFNNKNKL